MASYYVWSGATGSANGTSWANAYTTLTLAFSGHAAGDIYYVAHDHAESTGTAITLNSQGSTTAQTKVICANRSGSVPPVSADRRATATVTTTAASAINISGNTHYDGIIFNAGTSTSLANINLPSVAGVANRFDNCSFRLVATAATSVIAIGGSQTGTYTEFNNTTVSFGAVGQSISLRGGYLRWRNTPSALLGTIPTTLFTQISAWNGVLECSGIDFSAAGSGKTLVGALATILAVPVRFVDCKLDAAVTRSAVPAAIGSSTEIDFVRCGATGNYNVFRHRMSGTLEQETTIVRTSGGATDGVTPISWKVVSTANVTYSMAFESPPIAIWNDTTGSARTATIECIGAAVPNDDEVWVDVEYLGDASSPQGSFVNDGKANLLTTAAAQTSSSATWGGSTAAFKLAVTFTPQQKGWVYARVKVAKASTTVYVDPLITLT